MTEPVCDCEGPFTQTVHESNAEGHQVGCPRWGMRHRTKEDKFVVGTIVHGFAAGAFGRDSYYCRTVEAVGQGWIVTRNSVGEAEFTTYLTFDPNDRGHCDDYCPYEGVED